MFSLKKSIYAYIKSILVNYLDKSTIDVKK